jgi:hypothetical protein
MTGIMIEKLVPLFHDKEREREREISIYAVEKRAKNISRQLSTKCLFLSFKQATQPINMT